MNDRKLIRDLESLGFRAEEASERPRDRHQQNLYPRLWRVTSPKGDVGVVGFREVLSHSSDPGPPPSDRQPSMLVYVHRLGHSRQVFDWSLGSVSRQLERALSEGASP